MGIEDEIQRLRAKVAELDRQAELARAELKGMEAARKYIPDGGQRIPRQSKPSAGSGKRGGRQPGAISNRWKQVLSDLYALDGWFDDSMVVDTVFELENRKIKPTEIRRIFDGYVDHGYVEKGDRGLYRVTDSAAEKFGFERKAEMPTPPRPPSPPPPSPSGFSRDLDDEIPF